MSVAQGGRTMWRPIIAGAVLSALAFVVLVATFGAAEAQSGNRGVGLGIGVGTGLQILNQLSKGASSGNKKSTAKKKRAGTGSKATKKATKKTKPQRDDDDEPKSTSKGDDGSEQEETEAAPASQAAMPPAVGAAAAAPAVTGAVPSAASPAVNLISTKEEIASAQEHLRFLGYEVSEMTGVLDLNTKIAIMKFQDSIKAEATGGLTVEQLRRLYALAAEQQKQGN